MRTLATAAPIPYRQQNGGDYLIPSMLLRAGLEPAGASGFALHLKHQAGDGHGGPNSTQPPAAGLRAPRSAAFQQ
jgi:NAD(P)H dehydrogenase (quinone)